MSDELRRDTLAVHAGRGARAEGEPLNPPLMPASTFRGDRYARNEGTPGWEALVAFSRWITPAQVKIRFDTHFYLAPAPEGAEPRPDGAETVDLRWFTPNGALEAYGRDEILLVFPTIKTLEQLVPFASAEEILAWAEGREVVPIEPQVVVEGEVARVVLPGEPGYVA